MAEGLRLHLCISQGSTCTIGLLLPTDLASLQVNQWSQPMHTLCVRSPTSAVRAPLELAQQQLQPTCAVLGGP